MDHNTERLRQFVKEGALLFLTQGTVRWHFRLTSGRHSSGYFNSTLLIQNPVRLQQVVGDLVMGLRANNDFQFYEQLGIDLVVAPAMGGVILAYELARQLSHDKHAVLTAFAEKSTRGGRPAMEFKRHIIPKGSRILVVEDVITTGGSVNLVFDALNDLRIELLPMVGTIFNRSGRRAIGDSQCSSIISVADRHIPAWDPYNCPLCQEGSTVIEVPKSIAEFGELV